MFLERDQLMPSFQHKQIPWENKCLELLKSLKWNSYWMENKGFYSLQSHTLVPFVFWRNYWRSYFHLSFVPWHQLGGVLAQAMMSVDIQTGDVMENCNYWLQYGGAAQYLGPSNSRRLFLWASQKSEAEQ